MNAYRLLVWCMAALLSTQSLLATEAPHCSTALAKHALLVRNQGLAGDPYDFLGLSAKASPSTTLAGSKNSSEDYWRDVALSSDILKSFVSNEACYAGESEFLMCVAAINALLQFSKDPARLLPAQREAIARYVGPTQLSFGAAEVVQLKSLGMTDPVAVAKLNKKLRETIQSLWKKVFQSGKSIDFDRLLKWARRTLITPDKESYMTATAYNAAIAVADAHARIMPIAELQHETSSDVSDDLVGIGVVLVGHTQELVVQQAIEGGPADAAGMMAGDVITHVDGKALAGLKLWNATDGIRGKAGTQVKLTIRRGDRSFDLTLTRRAVELKNVTSRLYTRGSQKVGYIKLASFMAHSAPEQIAEAIDTLGSQGAQGLVLDLRGNPGGELNIAVKIAGLFLGPNKKIVTSRSLYPEAIPDQAYVTSNQRMTSLPLIVLVNAHSASASELLAGALQDYGRALIVGDRTFGKGSVQGSRDIASEDGVLHGYPIVMFETIARFLLPSGRTNQLIGITPDLQIDYSPNPTEAELYAEREEDIYPNALSALNKPYTPVPAKTREWLRACVEKTGVAKATYLKGQSNPYPLDYQLLYAADAMDCLRELFRRAAASGATR